MNGSWQVAALVALAALLAMPYGGIGAGEVAVAAAPDEKPCDCRAFGRIFHQGETACFGGGLRICGMYENVSSWIETGEACPLSWRNGPAKERAG